LGAGAGELTKRSIVSAFRSFLPAAVTALRTRAVFARELLRHPFARRRLFILLAGSLVCLYAVSVFWYVLSVPDIGLRCAFSTTVLRAYPGFFDEPAGGYEDLVGKTIVKVGTQPVESWPQLLRALADLPGDQPVDIVLADDGKLLHVIQCRPGRPPLASLAPSVLWFFLKAGLFVVGALVFWNRPGDRSAAQFFWLCIVTFGAYMGGYHWSRIITQPVLLLVFMVCSVLLPAVSLHFYLIFPRSKKFFDQQPRWTLLVLYGPPVLFLLTLLSGYLSVRWLAHEPARPGTGDALVVLLGQIRTEIYVYFAVAALWYVASVVCLIHSYASAQEATERNQVKWILCGALASLVPIGYTLYLAFREQNEFGGGKGAWPMFAASACVTIAFTVSITRYRLMQLDQLISSGVSYFLLSSLAGLVYYAVVFAGAWAFSQWFAGPSLTQALGVSSAALVLLLLLDFLRGRIKRALDRRFYRDKHHLDHTLKRMSQAIEKLVDPPALAQRMLQEAADLLGAGRGAVYLREGDPPLYRLAARLGEAPPLAELSSGCPVIEALLTRGTVPAQPRGTVEDPAQRQLHFLGGEMAHALQHEGQMLALLVLGPRKAGTYGPEELNQVAAFAQITALALVSAEGHRTIDALNCDLQAKVEKIAEQQRRILILQSQLTQRSVVPSPAPAVEDNASEAPGSIPAEQASSGLRTADIIGSSVQVRDLLQLVRRVSASEATVLIRGESGTGKELLAEALHAYSPRAGKAFVKVSCATFSPTLLESELFGHEKGSFTGAVARRIGRFEQANGGTLFLDEIGDVSLEVQTKLLRVLQEKTLERVGSSEPIKVDVRVLAATHRDLERLIDEERFRDDLYFRLNVIAIRVPPLRERREDIAELAQHFLRLYARRCGREAMQIDDDVLAALKTCTWPGNVRQLENVIERAVVVAEGPVITLRELPPELLDGLADDTAADRPGAELPPGVRAERAERDRREREQLVRALAATKGNKAEAARVLGLARSTLVSRLKKHGLS
jgi:transcriptional regulator with GAF, ATPase, and Fis domain